MKKRYWVSFDLGLKGNYDNLFEWLDTTEAKECGDFMATFVTERSKTQVENELKKTVDENARIYLISFSEGGKFIKGKRKNPNWAGYAKGTEESGIEK